MAAPIVDDYVGGWTNDDLRAHLALPGLTSREHVERYGFAPPIAPFCIVAETRRGEKGFRVSDMRTGGRALRVKSKRTATRVAKVIEADYYR